MSGRRCLPEFGKTFMESGQLVHSEQQLEADAAPAFHVFRCPSA